MKTEIPILYIVQDPMGIGAQEVATRLPGKCYGWHSASGLKKRFRLLARNKRANSASILALPSEFSYRPDVVKCAERLADEKGFTITVVHVSATRPAGKEGWWIS